MSKLNKLELSFDHEEAKGVVEIEETAYGVDITVNGDFIGSIDLMNLACPDNEDQVNFFAYSLPEDGQCKAKLTWKDGELIETKQIKQ